MFCCWYVEMLCKFCGKEIEENSVFCAECGKPVENSQAEGPVVDENIAQPNFAEPQVEEPVKKPKKKLAAIIAAVVAVVLIAVVTVASNFETVQGFFLKSFGSNDKYFMYVESKAFGSVTDEVSEYYGTVVDSLKLDAAAETSVKLNVGDSALSLLESTLDPSSDFSWLNTVTLDMNVNLKDNLEKVAAALNINGESFVDMDMIMNLESGETFMAFLSMSDKYLKTGTGILEDEDYVGITELYSDPEFKEVLPSEKELNKLLDKYIKIIFENMDEIEKSSDVLEVSGIEKKYTTLEVKIEQEDAKNIAKAVLEAAKADKELKKYIEDIAAYLEKKNMNDDAGIAYDVFLDSIEGAINDIEEASSEDDTSVSWIDYVDANHEIVGRKIVVDNEEILYYALVSDGKDFAFELEVAEVVVAGTGTGKGNTINGEFSVKSKEEKLCDVVVTDFKTNTDYLNGNIRIKPSSEILEAMGIADDGATVLSIANLALEINCVSSKDSAETAINLISGDEIFVGLTFSGKEVAASPIELPDTANVYSEDEIDKWLEGIDTDALIKKFEGLGVSSDLIAIIESMLYPSYNYDMEDYDMEDYDFEDYDYEDFDMEDYDLEDYDLEDYDLEDYDLEDFNLEDYDLEGVY